MRLCWLTVFSILACCYFGNGLRILGLFPLNGKSHWAMGQQLFLALAKRGHQVDVITHFLMKNPPPNYNQLSIENSLPPAVNSMHANDAVQFKNLDLSLLVQMTGTRICETLNHENVQKIIKNPPNDPPYDLIIVEMFMSPCYLAFGRHLNVPIVGVVTAPFTDWLHVPAGNSYNPAVTPSIFSSYPERMDFWQRLMNTVMVIKIGTTINGKLEVQQRSYVKNHFNLDVSMEDLIKDVSLYLVNSHHSLNGVKPSVPSIIEVGGLHVSEKADPNSPEVEKWLNESTHGCILFTFGSMVRIETFPKAFVEILYATFEKIAPVRVLMKVAKKEDLLPGLPKNVMIQPWFSQISVFKHKNLKAFITHGGLMSFQEALYFGIPVVGIPIFGDQSNNMEKAARKNIGVTLGSPENVTVETLSHALNKVLYDETYRENMKKTTELFRDRPMKAIDTAIFWVEYVHRHKNALQSPAIYLTWWQQNLLDVYGFLFACFAAVLFVVILVVRKLMRLFLGCKSCSKDSKTSESKKRK
ncbi:UDP-glucosyltransferase 2 [Nomia melanderi]|uniref:UDP-glucosyltransferase 2 n=1 Tax=Nomia melanderi TaxID=2448451 RepID=UPI003FCCEBAD